MTERESIADLLSLKDEILILRALVARRLKDLDDHPNPNLDRAMDSVCETVKLIESLCNTYANICNMRLAP